MTLCSQTISEVYIKYITFFPKLIFKKKFMMANVFKLSSITFITLSRKMFLVPLVPFN